MNIQTRLIAACELLLISPAALFMTALVARNLQPRQSEPAHTAQQIVMWYSERMWTLWALLLALPLAVLVTGCVTFAAIRAYPPALLATTLSAAAILVIVVLHMLAN